MDIEERKLYHTILVELWQAFTADYGTEFSDEYWEKLIFANDEIVSRYEDDVITKEFAERLSQLFLDVHEMRQKYGNKIFK